jgi:hypothetical protein
MLVDFLHPRGLMTDVRRAQLVTAIGRAVAYLQAVWRPTVPSSQGAGVPVSGGHVYGIYRDGTGDSPTFGDFGFSTGWEFRAKAWYARQPEAPVELRTTVRAQIADHIAKRFHVGESTLLPTGLEADPFTIGGVMDSDTNTFNALWSQLPIALGALARG